MDVPSTHAGKLVSVAVDVGDKVSEGDVIAVLEVADAASAGAAGEAEDAGAESAAPAREAPAEAPADAPNDAPGATVGGTVTVAVPDLGDFDSVDVIEIGVEVGDEVDVDDPLLTLETDKASMDVPSSAAGVVSRILVEVGDAVSPGTPIIELESKATAATPGADTIVARAQQSPPKSVAKKDSGAGAAQPAESKPEPPPKAAPEPQPATPPREGKPARPAIDEAGFATAHASPSVRKLARELGVDLARVEGTGVKKRVTADDVKAWVKRTLESGGPPAGAPRASAGGVALPAVPVVDFARFGEVEEQPLTRIQKISGPRLQASWINIPHVTQHDLADITDMEAKRQALKGAAAKRDIKLTPLAFVMKAAIMALQEFPRVNASLSADGERLVLKRYYHIGFAADTPNGLVVPVIRDADKKDIYELATELGELSAAARDGKLKADQMQGASFTISSLGGIGGTAFTPIVNAPEVAILGVSRSTMQPVWNGDEFVPRLMLPLSLSYDHRVIDGAAAVRFTTYLGEALGNVEKLVEAIP
jgi:pyruvate dehydrogenase E2 component (dihydrolipoamide acetyltransferase)